MSLSISIPDDVAAMLGSVMGELAGVPEAVHPYAGAWWPPGVWHQIW